MPLYYFHTDDDDTDGIELPDDAAARAAARETFGVMVKEGSFDECAMEVVDSTGRRVAKLTFSIEA